MERGDDTKDRILDAAWALAAERGSAEIAVGEVAREAGVSRQLVYFHFANRAGLLDAMVRRHDRVQGIFPAVAATRELPPAEALEALVRVWLAYVPEIHPVARALEAAQIRGEDGGAAWENRMHHLREAYHLAVERLAEHGRLRDGWTVEQAADWAWSRSHLEAWHQLVVECGWDAAEATERLTRSILAEVVA